MEHHPDRAFRDYIVTGLKEGFRIGFKDSEYRPAKTNMRSALEQPHTVSRYLQEECATGRVIGPLAINDFREIDLMISRFGVIPKGSTGKWRLIVDLSFPEGGSVNNGIESDICSLHYAKVEEATKELVKQGHNSWMAKVDIKSAYRTVPVHPQDWWLLGMQWEGALFVDTTLPFGLRSAPKIFTAVADAAEWIVKRRGVQFCIHYLDDYLIIGSSREQCSSDLQTMLSTFSELGLPVAENKLEGPSTCLTFLGFELDSRALEMRLPSVKLLELQQTSAAWVGRRSCRKKELESLVGKLSHASRVVQPGKTFLRQLFELLKGTHKGFHHIRLNVSARSDIYWWSTFVQSWNGVSLLREFGKEEVDHYVTTDASGQVGCGGLWHNKWFQIRWTPEYRITKNLPLQDSIMLRELLPVVIAAAVWGPEWKNSVVVFQCDNEGAVSAINSGYSRVQGILHLLRCLFFIRAHYGIHIRAVHIPGNKNVLADAISRDNLSLLFSQVPEAASGHTLVPQDLVEVLVNKQVEWTSASWCQQFRNCLRLV